MTHLDYYARRANEYEGIYTKPERQQDLECLHGWLAQQVRGCHVLELACGTGYWTQVMAGTAAHVLASDMSREVLEIAQGKNLPGNRVSFARINALEMPMLRGYFDTVFAGFWWSHVPRQDLHEFLDGLQRALGDGVRCLFIDNRYVEGSSTPIARTDKWGNTWQQRRLADGSTHAVLKNFPSADELTRQLSGRAREIEIVERPYYWALSYRTQAVTPCTEPDDGRRNTAVPQA